MPKWLLLYYGFMLIYSKKSKYLSSIEDRYLLWYCHLLYLLWLYHNESEFMLKIQGRRLFSKISLTENVIYTNCCLGCKLKKWYKNWNKKDSDSSDELIFHSWNKHFGIILGSNCLYYKDVSETHNHLCIFTFYV